MIPVGLLDGWRARGRIRELGYGSAPSESSPRNGSGVPVAMALLGAVLIAIVFGTAGLVLGVAVAPALALGWRRRSRSRDARARREQLPEALERLAGAMRTGSSLPQALADTAPSTPAPLGLELSALARGVRHGRAMSDVLDSWTDAHGDRGTRLAATALNLAATVGSAPARAVDGVAATLRERLQLAGERRALATQARASAFVLSVAPLAFVLLFGITDGATAKFLLHTPGGWACLVVGLGLDAIGAWWMARLTRGVEP